MNWKNIRRVVLFGIALDCNALPAFANFAMSPSGSTTAFAIDASNQGTALCAAASTECPASVPINTAGAPMFVTGTPGLVTGTGGTFPATQSGNWTSRVVGNAGAIMDFAGQNASSPANSLLSGCQFNTSPTTITSGNASPVQCDNAGNHLVNVKTSVLPTLASTSTKQSDGSQKTQIVDGSGNVIASTGNALNVTAVNATTPGRAAPSASSPVVQAYNVYQAVAASATATPLQTSTGATGDYLSHCVIYPTSLNAGVVTVFDNTNTAPNSAILFAGGTPSLSNFAPIAVPVGAISKNGAWKVTTGTGVSVVCYGTFS